MLIEYVFLYFFFIIKKIGFRIEFGIWLGLVKGYEVEEIVLINVIFGRDL